VDDLVPPVTQKLIYLFDELKYGDRGYTFLMNFGRGVFYYIDEGMIDQKILKIASHYNYGN
jgi:hypothetical protein